jgi:hypothetical protein
MLIGQSLVPGGQLSLNVIFVKLNGKGLIQGLRPILCKSQRWVLIFVPKTRRMLIDSQVHNQSSEELRAKQGRKSQGLAIIPSIVWMSMMMVIPMRIQSILR